MRVTAKICVVTGGASGIGKALCERFAAEDAAGVVVVDRNVAGAEAVASAIGGLAVGCDLGVEADVNAMVAAVIDHYGRVDVLCNNAGIVNDQDFLTGSIEPWAQQWAVNVMAHVYATRAVLPAMLERGEGYLQHTASMAGYIPSLAAPAYCATKYAVVGLAEWLTMTYGHRGIGVFVLAPIGVDTPLLAASPKALQGIAPVSTPEKVAQLVIDGFDEGRFLTLTDPLAAEWMQQKATDLERFLEGMRRLQDRFLPMEEHS